MKYFDIESEKKFLDTVKEAERISKELGIRSVSREDAFILYTSVFLYSSKATNVKLFEAGCGAGYSTLWLAKGIMDADARGEIIAVDYEKNKLDILKKMMATAGVKIKVNVRQGDSVNIVKEYNDLDIIFFDHEKERYLETLDIVSDILVCNGLILIHNVILPFDLRKDILEWAKKNSMSNIKWIATFVPTPAGMGIMRKKCEKL